MICLTDSPVLYENIDKEEVQDTNKLTGLDYKLKRDKFLIQPKMAVV